MPTIWLWGGFGVALGGFGWSSPLFLLSAFCFVLLQECGFGWLAALPRSRFKARRSRFDVQPPAGTSNGGKPPAARLPQAWLILLGQAEAAGAPGILKVLPRESRNRNQISLNAETQRARRSAEEKSFIFPLSLRSSANLSVSALILRRLRGDWSKALQSHRLFPRRAPVPPAPNPNQDTAPHTPAQEWDKGRPNPPGG